MQRKSLALPWGGYFLSQEGWRGRLQAAYLAPRLGQVTHVLVRRGILRRSVTLRLDNAQQEADGVLVLPPQQGSAAPARGSVPFTTRTLVHCSDGASLPLQGLVLDRQRRHVERILVGGPANRRVVPIAQVQKLTSGSPSIDFRQADAERLPVFRHDGDAEKKAVAALEKADLTGTSFGNVQVQVVDGTAYLTGNVRLPVQKADAEQAVAGAQGVLRVQNAIVTDWDLELAIAQALAKEGISRQGVVTVKSFLGRVTLQGHLATQELVERAVALAAGVAGVRPVEHTIQVQPLPAPEGATVKEAVGN